MCRVHGQSVGPYVGKYDRGPNIASTARARHKRQCRHNHLVNGTDDAGQHGQTKRGDPVAHVALVSSALSVSGGTLRAYADGEVLRGHVIDPRSGVPVKAARLAWVIHASAAASDALATALLVDGPLLRSVDSARRGFLKDPDAPVRRWPANPCAPHTAHVLGPAAPFSLVPSPT